eukprot:scaffold36669_cov49-Cyclotella_meneghiniana.AAC.4
MSHPPCTPMAKLSAIAVIRRIADGIPSGRSFVLSFDLTVKKLTFDVPVKSQDMFDIHGRWLGEVGRRQDCCVRKGLSPMVASPRCLMCGTKLPLLFMLCRKWSYGIWASRTADCSDSGAQGITDEEDVPYL